MKRFLYLIGFILVANAAISQMPTRAQLQPINAKGYEWLTGSFKNGLYLPDTLSSADSGCIAQHNGVFYLKKGPKWIVYGKVAILSDSSFIISGDTVIVRGNAGTTWCNAKNSGADATGVLDASPYIQALINSGCKVIYIPAGTYLLGSTIQMKDSVIIKGDGRATIFKLTKNKPGFKCGWALGGNKSQFLDFSFIGTYPQDSTLQDGIFSDSCNGIYVNNISSMKVAGWAVHLKRNGFCCGGYPLPTGVLGNIISDCWIDSSYGGVMHDTLAEFNSTVNCTVVRGKYGLFTAAGSSRFADCNVSGVSYGLTITGGSNNAHGTITNSHFAHCRKQGLYITGATNGYEFIGCNIRQDSITITNSDNIRFTSCELGAIDSGINIVTSTNTIFNLCRVWGSRPFGSVSTGTKMISSDSATNGISIVDLPNAKRLDISHTNGVVDFAGTGITKIRSIADTIVFSGAGNHYISGGENATDTLNLYSTLNATITGGIRFGRNIPANGVVAGLWNTRNGFLGIGTLSPQTPLHVRNARPSFQSGVTISEDVTCSSCGSVLVFQNDGQATNGQIFVGSTTNAFMPRGMMMQCNGADGIKFVTSGSSGQDFEFAGSVNPGTSSYAKIKGGTGNLQLYNVPAPIGAYNLLVHGLTDSGTYEIPSMLITTQNWANTNLRFTGNRSHSAGFQDYVLDSVRSFTYAGHGTGITGTTRHMGYIFNATSSSDLTTNGSLLITNTYMNAANNADSVRQQLLYDANGVQLQHYGVINNQRSRVYLTNSFALLQGAASVEIGPATPAASTDSTFGVGPWNAARRSNDIYKIPRVMDQVHTSGTTVTISNNVTRLFVDPASAIASLGITFPAAPYEGQVIRIFFGGSITSGNVVTGGISSWGSTGAGFIPVTPVSATPVTAGQTLVFEYRAANTYWYQVK